MGKQEISLHAILLTPNDQVLPYFVFGWFPQLVAEPSSSHNDSKFER